MNFSFIKSKKGFTLIELLVVISIISLLSSVVLAALNDARMKARDARRISDLRQIRIALESYFADNGYYPPASVSAACPTGYNCTGYLRSNAVSGGANWDLLANQLAKYISLPKDPLNTTNTGCGTWEDNSQCRSYAYGNVYNTPNGIWRFDLITVLEDPNNSLRCELKKYKRENSSTGAIWCATYSTQIYDNGVE